MKIFSTSGSQHWAPSGSELPSNMHGLCLVKAEGRSSRPPVDVVPEELLQESQWVVRPRRSKVSVVGNDMHNITKRYAQMGSHMKHLPLW